MSIPFDQQRTQSGNSIFEDVYVYGKISGNLTGNVTGNLTGNVTGNLTGDVSGNLTGDVNAGVVTATTFYGNGSALTGIDATSLKDSDGNVKVQAEASGAVVTGVLTASTSINVGDTFLKQQSVGLGTTSTAGRNAGVSTAIGTIIYNATTNFVQLYTGTGASGWKNLAFVTVEATGGTTSTVDGYRYHVFTGPGTFEITSGSGDIEVVAVGAGGGGGGADGNTSSDTAPQNGAGGSGGGVVYGSISLSTGSYTISTGGGGGGAASGVTGSGGGAAGPNGGGSGGNAGGNPNSGGGGGGGGWSGFRSGSTYYFAGGGGAGGGGSNEGPANNIQPRGGGDPGNTYRTDSSTGTSGSPYPGDGGGWAGCGGGISNVPGGAGGGSGNQSHFGGSNFINPEASGTSYAGDPGGYQGNPATNYRQGGVRAPGFSENPVYPRFSPFLASYGNGGAGSRENPQGSGAGGSGGIVIVSYEA
jgi:hypothetical protein